MQSKIILLSLLVFISACKTREDIAREQMVDNIAVQIQDNQKLSADVTVRLQQIEERINAVTGKVEETQHEATQSIDTKVKSVEERLTLIETNQASQAEQLKNIEGKLKEQDKYLKNVLSTLQGLSKKPTSSKKKLSKYQQAMNHYGKGRYSQAKPILEELLDNKKLRSSQIARITHNLGMIAYMDKDNQKALIYFSKLFTKYPKTGYNKNGLLFLAKTFERLGQKEEAKQTLNELIAKFPKAKQVSKAKKMLGKL